MRRIQKIFTAVVFGAFAFSCATDTTEDLGVQVNGGQTTEITLSLEESRTQLGKKADGIYPLYWSEGDAISANGVASATLSAAQAGSAAATFVINGEVKAPYCIAYPAAAVNQVLFAAQQSHASNTSFGAGVSTMYGYSENGLNIELQHLTGVLKIGVTGDAVLSHAQISTIDRAPIAGAFDFDFEKGEATATEASESVINYSFGEGVQLSNEPTYIHVAVPAGVYDELYVTLYDNAGGVMYAIVKADENKPLAVGKVRAFSQNIAFAAKNSNLFVISSAQTLKAFAEAAPSLEKDALLVADIDMSNEEWTPIEGYAKTINGNGYAIKGLKAPLFGTTSAKIKGLHLTELNAEWATLARGGAFACELGKGGLLSHCSASGNIVINNTTYTTKQVKANKDIAYGGLVGLASSSTIEHCVNKANMTFKSITASIAAYDPSLGGIVGATDFATDSTTACSISYVTNRGNMFIENQLCTGLIDWGGIIGVNLTINALAEFNYVENYGKLHTNPGIKFNIQMGGVFGNLSSSDGKYFGAENATHWHNYGDIDIQGYGVKSNACISGIGRTFSLAGELSDVLNRGDINVSYSSRTLYVSGTTLGFYAGSASKIKNEGDITISTYDAESKIATLYATGWCNNCTATINGTSTDKCGNSGNITIDAACTGALYATGTAIAFSKTITHIVNSGNITVSGSVDGETIISGIANSISGAITDVLNSGKISTTATHTGALQVAGIVASSFTGLNMLRVNNSGDLDINSDIQNALRVAGFWTSNNNTANYVTFTDCHNSGYINVVGTTTTTANNVSHTGGFIGYTNKPVTFDGCSNSGKVVDGVEKGIYVERNCNAGYFCVGGAIGWCYNADVTIRNGFTNSAKIHSKVNNSYNKLNTALGYPVGGIIAIYHKAEATFDWEGEVKNTGEIVLEGGTTATRLGVGGIVGISNATATCEANLVNTGKIVLKKEAVVSSTYGFGGIFGITAGSIKNAKCFCNVEAIDNDYPFGFITGSTRSDVVKAIDCYIGGSIARNMEEKTNTDGDSIGEAPSFVAMDADSFCEHIYSTSISKTTAAEDGCGYISSIDATPVVPQAE